MDQGALVNERKEAGARLSSEFDKYAHVQSAFWLKDEDGLWSLYLASEQITDDNVDVGYGEVLRIAQSLDDPALDPFEVKLLGADDPLALAVAEIQRRHPGRSATIVGDSQLGGNDVAELYVYGSPVAVPGS